ncbi:MAG: glycerol-3-phosphate 1-O-acyltransferase PlsY [Candidatus Aminicenantales bacterium]
MKVLFAVLSYLIGSFPTGYLLVYLTDRKDIRHFGSHSTGATNVLRVKGWGHAIPVLLGDVLKGFLPVFLALRFIPDRPWAYLCGFLAVVGHCFPVFLKFRGGKGVATSVGVYLAVAPALLGIAVAVFGVLVLWTRYVSAGSLLAMLSLPVSIALFRGDAEKILLAAGLFLLVTLRHRENIQRLIKGQERRLGERL